MSEYLVQFENLKVFENVLNGTIRKGDLIGVIGQNGTGKTTFAHVISGKIQNYQGVIKRTIGFPEIFFSDFSADNSHFHYSDFYYQQRYQSSDPANTESLGEFLGLRDLGDKSGDLASLVFGPETMAQKMIELSSGETRKALVLKNLLQVAAIHILDNPFTGMDNESIGRFVELFRMIVSSGEKAIVLLLNENRSKIPFGKVILLENKEKLSLLSKAKTQESKLFQRFFLPFSTDIDVVFQIKNADLRVGGKALINDLNWTIKKGEKWLLQGVNGSGKSTLMSLMNADNPMAYGLDIILFDKERGTGESIWDIKSKIGFVSPEIQLFWNGSHTVRNIVMSGFTDTIYLNRQLSDSELKDYNNIVEVFGLGNKQDRLFGSLSTGEKKMVMIARTMVKNPPVLILDEMFQGVDSLNFEFLYQFFTNCAHEGRTIIQIAHYDHEILPIIQHKAFIEGKAFVVKR